jgi:hypothetical protein
VAKGKEILPTLLDYKCHLTQKKEIDTSIYGHERKKERKKDHNLGNNFVHGEYMVVEKGRNYSLKDNCALENNLMPTMHHKNVFQPTLSQMSIDMFY